MNINIDIEHLIKNLKVSDSHLTDRNRIEFTVEGMTDFVKQIVLETLADVVDKTTTAVDAPAYGQKNSPASNRAVDKDTPLSSRANERYSTHLENPYAQTKTQLTIHDLREQLSNLKTHVNLVESTLRKNAPEILYIHLAEEIRTLAENFANNLSDFFHQPYGEKA